MNLDRALTILCAVHTHDDRQAGFQIKTGAMPGSYPGDTSRAEHVEACQTVRAHIGLPSEPEQPSNNRP